MLKNHIKITFRNLWRNKMYSGLNIGGLALGMTASILLLLWVQNELRFDAYHQRADRIYRVTNTLQISPQDSWVWSNSPLVLGDFAQKQIPEVEKVARFQKPWSPLVVRINHELFKEPNAAYVDSTWFEVFDYQFVIGSPKIVFKDYNSIVLTQSKAKTFFGDAASAIGQTIRLDSTDYVVKGIVRDNPAQSSFQFDLMLPIAALLKNPEDAANDRQWGNFNYQLFLQLVPGSSTKAVGAKLTNLFRTYKKDTHTIASLLPLTDIHFAKGFQRDELASGNERTTQILGIVGLLILIIACINYVNLSTARASTRSKEVGVKKLIGAERGRLFGQFLTESLVFTLLALGLTLALVELLLPFFNDFTKKHFVFTLSDPGVASILLGTMLVTIFLSGIYPALLLSSFQPIQVLKGNQLLGTKTTHFRKALVVLQFTISITLIIGTLGIFKQLHFIQTHDPGYSREGVFSLELPSDEFRNRKDREAFKTQLRTLTSIDGVTATSLPLENNPNSMSGGLQWKGKAEDFNPTVSALSVEPEFQPIFNLKLLEGRWFSHAVRMDTANVILNEKAVKTLGLKPPYVGQSITFNGRAGQIIGIVKDFHFRNFHEAIAPAVLFYDLSWQRTFYVKASLANTSRALAETEKIWKRLYPDQPFGYHFMEESFQRLHEQEQQTGILFNLFATIAILISCLGLFGLATYTVEVRTKEIGIRKVLGASVFHISSLISKDFVVLVLIAFAMASPLAWYALDRWLEGFAYRASLGGLTFGIGGLIALVIALVTVSTQAIRAANADPVKSLKSE
ncbi:ABC transporter permease [Siphonobacter sp. SORGH_AS_0500]|uniref:ABC transporter permease n=1 Tax=Siphonobacter sp. SORGH_AS_0500 TaxID=1864824 RepID=UPI0028563DB5|nr:ABC transporter permease [Siphonobacter sp. SORGH_AS_0500]MDR6196098.1 putative ABC transport system permease protein [Siphonobacter sp. SORGH_AS_0500]